MSATIPITSVTVHPDGALVRRRGPAPVVDGALVIGGLPLMLDPTSLRVGVAGATLRQIRVELELLGMDRSDEPAPIAQLRQAQEQLRTLESTTAALTAERQHAIRLAPDFDPEGPAPSAEALERWLALEQAIEPWVARIDEALREQRDQRRQLAEQINVITAELASLSDEGIWQHWAPTRRAILDVEAPAAGEDPSVELSYRIRGASWSPAYTLDTDGALTSGRFAMRALVIQETGEDWSGVALKLTTAPSSRTVDLPSLPSLRLGTQQPPPPPAWRPLPAGLESLFPEDLQALVSLEGEGGIEPEPTLPLTSTSSGWSDDIDLDGVEEELDILTEAEAWPNEAGDSGIEDLTISVEHSMDLPAPQHARVMRSPSLLRSAPGNAPAPPPPPPSATPLSSSAPAPQTSKPKPKRRRPPPRPTPPVLEVEVDLLDYGRLRLRSYDAQVGARGRLQPIDDRELLAESGLPQAAADHLLACLTNTQGRFAAIDDRPLPPHHVLPAPVGEGDQTFEAEGLVELPSDGRTHSVAVFAEPVALEVRYRTVPRHDPRAFRRVLATLEHDGPLLPGPVDVYVDGALELSAGWSGSAGRGGLVLGLGVEDRLKVVRNVRYREERAGLLGGSRRMHTTVEVRVASSLPDPVRIQVLERVPVPADPNAGPEIEITTSTPIVRAWGGDANTPILDGAKVQLLDVPAEGEARAVLGYAITLGAREELVGGDRRG